MLLAIFFASKSFFTCAWLFSRNVLISIFRLVSTQECMQLSRGTTTPDQATTFVSIKCYGLPEVSRKQSCQTRFKNTKWWQLQLRYFRFSCLLSRTSCKIIIVRQNVIKTCIFLFIFCSLFFREVYVFVRPVAQTDVSWRRRQTASVRHRVHQHCRKDNQRKLKSHQERNWRRYV